MGKIVNVNSEYKEWIKDISKKFKQCQIKAASKVNEEMLVFYWSLGRDILKMSKKSVYGSEFFRKISKDLQRELPDIKSFSVSNLRYMCWFYELYQKNPQQDVVESVDLQKSQQDVVDYVDKAIFKIPWGHHIQIIGKCRE